MPPKLTKELIQKRIYSEGYTCISYDVKTKKFGYICPKGCNGAVRMDHWNRGVRCACISKNKKLNTKQVVDDITNAGYKFLDDKYLNSKTPMSLLCPNGHTYKVSWNNWSTGYRCSECSGTKKKNLYQINKSFNEEGYLLKSKTYLSNKQQLDCVCSNGHTYKVSWDNWSNKKSRCPKCSACGSSKAELELVNFVKTIYDGEILTNDRTIIAPKELDIVIPNLKIAIEYCGLYWHSELQGKDRNYHVDKLNKSLDSGYTLITVFEDEWLFKKDITKSRMASYINSSNMPRIHARKCHIKELSSKQAGSFCNDNHLQGYGAGSSIKLGAFYESELVALMTFSKPSLSKGCKHYKKGVWELHRFCSKQNHIINGIASKLLKYFEKNYYCKEVFSFADKRWSTGNIYKNLGFKYDSDTKPNYWYFKDNKKRFHRFGLRKNKNDLQELTEVQNRILQGYNRIWDCGNVKFIKLIN